MRPIDTLHQTLPTPADASPAVAANAEVNAAAPSDDPRYRARVTAAAEKFEAFFIADMLKQMRSATRALADEDSVLHNRINQDMLEIADGKLADAMAGQRAFGIADAILRQLLPPTTAVSPVPEIGTTPSVAPETSSLSRR